VRNPVIGRRSNSRVSGRVVNTQQELWRAKGAANYNTSNTGVARKLVELFTGSDYTGSGPYQITWTHNLGTSDYIWHVITTDNNGPIIVEHFWQGDDELQLFFTGNTRPIKVIIMV
jgi:hypothetical protein